MTKSDKLVTWTQCRYASYCFNWRPGRSFWSSIFNYM